jgi:4-methyl-5(b-hydroxyethyl)-thiazole monophosphate biosynthesis
MKRVLVPLATGFEEVEALTVVDYLRRAGAQVVTASVGAANPITGRSKIRVMADIDLSEALAEWGDAFDLVVLPGGPGVASLAASETLMAFVRARLERRQPTAAICAAPTVLAAAGLDRATRITSWPGSRPELADFARYAEERVVVDGPVITSRGPGTAVPFALALVTQLFGAEAADKLARDTVSS